MPEPDCSLLRGILRREIPIGGGPLERAVVLKWFYSLSRQKTFVGGKCPSSYSSYGTYDW